MSIAAIEKLIEAVDALRQAALKLKGEFEVSINDQTIPLDTRWDLWVRAPREIKNTDCFLPDFDILGEEIVWYDDFNMNRHETMECDSLIRRMEESTNWREPGSPATYTKEQIDDVKRQILRDNLFSFENDW